jgi:hypothetical protein
MDKKSSPLPPRDRPPFDQADSATGAPTAAAHPSPELIDALDEALGLILDAYQLHTYDAEAVKRLEGVLAKARAEQVTA